MTPSARTCPVCGTTGALRIVYGLPTADLFDDPTVAIGGCVLPEDPPTRRCSNPACRHEFGSGRERSLRR